MFTAYSPDNDESYRAVRDDALEALDDDSRGIEHGQVGHVEGVAEHDDEHEAGQEARLPGRSRVPHQSESVEPRRALRRVQSCDGRMARRGDIVHHAEDLLRCEVPHFRFFQVGRVKGSVYEVSRYF